MAHGSKTKKWQMEAKPTMAHRFKTKKWQIEAKPTWHPGPRPKSGKSRLNLHGMRVQDQEVANQG
jgi:hypothetical protein